MANIILCHGQQFDDGGWYGSTGPADAAVGPITNLQKMQPKDYWQTEDVSSQISRYWDLGTSASWNFFAILFTNASSTGTFAIGHSTNTPAGTFTNLTSGATLRAAGQSTASGARYHAFYLHTATITSRYFRFQITDTSNGDGYFRAGRVVVGLAVQPTLNMEYGMTFGYDDVSPRVQTTNGEVITRTVEPIPVARFTLQATGTSAESEMMGTVRDFYRRRGASKDVTCVLDPSDTTLGGVKCIYGLMGQSLAIELPAYSYYRSTFEVRGLL